MIKDARNIIIVILCLIVVGMGTGYAYLQDSVTVESNTNLTGAKWDVGIESVEACTADMALENSDCMAPTGLGTDITGSTVINDFDKTKVIFATNLTEPGDSVTYKVVIANKGSLDAELKTLSWDKNDIEVKPAMFAYNGIIASEKINHEETKTFYVTVSYEEMEDMEETTQTSVSNTLGLSFIQANNR